MCWKGEDEKIRARLGKKKRNSTEHKLVVWRVQGRYGWTAHALHYVHVDSDDVGLNLLQLNKRDLAVSYPSSTKGTCLAMHTIRTKSITNDPISCSLQSHGPFDACAALPLADERTRQPFQSPRIPMRKPRRNGLIDYPATNTLLCFPRIPINGTAAVTRLQPRTSRLKQLNVPRQLAQSYSLNSLHLQIITSPNQAH